MTGNPEFQSPSGEWFWKPLDPSEKKVLADTIVRDCRRGIRSGIIMCCMMAFAFIFGIYTYLTDFENSRFFVLMTLTVPIPALIMFISSIISSKRYIEKAQENRFKARHVKVTDRRFRVELIGNRCEVYLQATDEEHPDKATVEIERTLYERMPVGLTGQFIMIEDERKKMLVSPYWFIPDSDPKATVNPSASVTAGGTAPEADLHESVKKAFRREHGTVITTSILAAMLFFFGGLFILGGIISRDGFYMFAGGVVCLSAVIIVTRYFTEAIFRGRKGMFFIWAVWLNINVFGLLPLMVPVEGIAFKVIILAGLFLMNLGAIALSQIEMLGAMYEISKRRYRTLPVTLRSTDVRRRLVFPVIFINIYTCVVEDSDGNTYEVTISRGQKKRLTAGTAGCLVTLTKGSRQFFFEKL